jgi:hypothetical protein
VTTGKVDPIPLKRAFIAALDPGRRATEHTFFLDQKGKINNIVHMTIEHSDKSVVDPQARD